MSLTGHEAVDEEAAKDDEIIDNDLAEVLGTSQHVLYRTVVVLARLPSLASATVMCVVFPLPRATTCPRWE